MKYSKEEAVGIATEMRKDGYTFKQIAEEIGCEPITARRWVVSRDGIKSETKLKRYLLDRGITQKWLAHTTGVGEIVIWNAANGCSDLRISTANKIAKALGTNLDTLFGE